ncbi:MAG: hypothetical protein DRO36_04245 [Candidatus Hecatellales archaeon]|nr:MAG: hypothetical protein DRO36_04245 [Candidatus Hecatellales archaeon]
MEGKSKERKCVICSNESDGGEFCVWHRLSYERLEEMFKVWREAMEIGWKEFLEEVRKNPNTGVWVKEVISYILKKENP